MSWIDFSYKQDRSKPIQKMIEGYFYLTQLDCDGINTRTTNQVFIDGFLYNVEHPVQVVQPGMNKLTLISI